MIIIGQILFYNMENILNNYLSCFSSDDVLEKLNEYKSIRNDTIEQLK